MAPALSRYTSTSSKKGVDVAIFYGRSNKQLEAALRNDLRYINKTKARRYLKTVSLFQGSKASNNSTKSPASVSDFTSDAELSRLDPKTEKDLAQAQSANNKHKLQDVTDFKEKDKFSLARKDSLSPEQRAEVELNKKSPAVMWVTASLEAEGDKLTLTRPSGDVLRLARAVEDYNKGDSL